MKASVNLSSSDSKLSEDGTNTSSEGQSSTVTDDLSQIANSSDKETSSSTTSATVNSNTQTCAYSASNKTLKCAEKTYKTVVIGDQTWMAENLNYGNYLADEEDENQFQTGHRSFAMTMTSLIAMQRADCINGTPQ